MPLFSVHIVFRSMHCANAASPYRCNTACLPPLPDARLVDHATHISLLLQLLCFAVVLLLNSIIKLPAVTHSPLQFRTALKRDPASVSALAGLQRPYLCRLADLRSCSSCCSTESFSAAESCCCGAGAVSSLLGPRLALRCRCVCWLTWRRVGTSPATVCCWGPAGRQ